MPDLIGHLSFRPRPKAAWRPELASDGTEGGKISVIPSVSEGIYFARAAARRAERTERWRVMKLESEGEWSGM